MSEKYKLTEEEINQSLLYSPYSLPDSPAQKGLASAQVKKHFYEFIRFFAKMLNLHLEDVGKDFEITNQALASLEKNDGVLNTSISSNKAEIDSIHERINFLSNFIDSVLSSQKNRIDSVQSVSAEAFDMADAAYNLARGKSRVHPVAEYSSLDDYLCMHAVNSINVGDFIILGDKNVPDFLVLSDDISVGYDMELPTNVTVFDFTTGRKYYHARSGLVLLAIESGIDVSKLVTKEELTSYGEGVSARLTEIDKELGSVSGALTELHNYAEALKGGEA